MTKAENELSTDDVGLLLRVNDIMKPSSRPTTDQIMEGMGFSYNDCRYWHYASELWHYIDRQLYDKGLIYTSPGTWSSESNLTTEQRAKHILAFY